MKVTVTSECVACGTCVEVCPEVFDLSGDVAEVLVAVVPEQYEDAVRQAAEECPSEAIIVEE